MLLLGFGLVQIPRAMLREADPAQCLRHAYHKCAVPPTLVSCVIGSACYDAYLSAKGPSFGSLSHHI